MEGRRKSTAETGRGQVMERAQRELRAGHGQVMERKPQLAGKTLHKNTRI
jgi:hypothetical protein